MLGLGDITSRMENQTRNESEIKMETEAIAVHRENCQSYGSRFLAELYGIGYFK